MRKALRIALAAALAAALLAMAGVLVRDALRLREFRRLTPRFRLGAYLTGAVGPPSVDRVEAWMTFDYLNRTFKLDAPYLKSALGISDARYPRLSIDEFAEDAKITGAAALMRVRQALRTATASAP